jgi:hypothetical protein
MQTKIVTVVFVLFLLFSFRGFSQSTEKSLHPLLDKYYPQPEAPDTNKAVTSQIKSSSQANLSPGGKTIPAKTSTPAFIPTAVTVFADTTGPEPTTTQSVTTIPSMTPAPVLTSTSSVNKPTTVTADIPTPKKIQAQPPQSAPIDMRLGSSTKQYDTWQKNNNGAGSVTTSPK